MVPPGPPPYVESESGNRRRPGRRRKWEDGMRFAGLKKRQKVRRIVVTAAFLLLPVTLYYFSPVLSVQAAAAGIVAGSVIVFLFLFASSLLVGRLFCGWACPAGGLQELVGLFRRRPVNRRAVGWIQWLIWVPWLFLLVFLLLQAGGVKAVSFFYQTRRGVSVTDLPGAVALASVALLFFLLAAGIGRRAGCHTVCWMAPFMVIGRSIRNAFGWPALSLAAEGAGCAACGSCSRECPMSIDAMERVREGRLECRDCILCGSCADACPRKLIRYSFAKGSGNRR